jgi:hypothetical protein
MVLSFLFFDSYFDPFPSRRLEGNGSAAETRLIRKHPKAFAPVRHRASDS